MRVDEIIVEQQLDEINLKQALAAGLIGAASLATPKLASISHQPPHFQQQEIEQWKLKQAAKQARQDKEARLVSAVMSKYNIDKQLASDIVSLAHKYEYKTFPTAKDILAVVGIESSFNPSARSNLARDPALGLMQVRAGAWGLDPSQLGDIEQQIKHGSEILHRYYQKVKNKSAALNAYNVGLTAFRRGDDNPNYVDKFRKEIKLYKNI